MDINCLDENTSAESRGSKFTCADCEKTFSRKDKLKQHIENIHSENIPKLSCEHCDKIFFRNDIG